MSAATNSQHILCTHCTGDIHQVTDVYAVAHKNPKENGSENDYAKLEGTNGGNKNNCDGMYDILNPGYAEKHNIPAENGSENDYAKLEVTNAGNKNNSDETYDNLNAGR